MIEAPASEQSPPYTTSNEAVNSPSLKLAFFAIGGHKLKYLRERGDLEKKINTELQVLAEGFLNKRNKAPSLKKARGAQRWWEKLDSRLQRSGESENMSALNQSLEASLPGFVQSAGLVRGYKKDLRNIRKSQKNLDRWSSYQRNRNIVDARLDAELVQHGAKMLSAQEIAKKTKQVSENLKDELGFDIPPELIKARLSRGAYSPRNELYKTMLNNFGVSHSRPRSEIVKEVLAAKDRKIVELTEQVEELEADNGDLLKVGSLLFKENQELTEENTGLAQRVQALEQQLSATEAQNQALSAENASLNGLVGDLGKNIAGLGMGVEEFIRFSLRTGKVYETLDGIRKDPNFLDIEFRGKSFFRQEQPSNAIVHALPSPNP